MESENKSILDWLNLPAGQSELSLWDILHDGDVVSISSDLLARTVVLIFDVKYVRDFHHLPEDTRSKLVVDGVESVRASHSAPWPGGCTIPDGATHAEKETYIAEYHRKWREESIGWADFEKLIVVDSEVLDATLVRSADTSTLKFGFLVKRDSYIGAHIRGGAISCYLGADLVSVDKFVEIGEAYWRAFAARQKKT